jgi:natural product precursor
METKQPPKLSLKRETITKLSDDQMKKIVGGLNPSSSKASCDNSSCNSKGSGSCTSASCNCAPAT